MQLKNSIHLLPMYLGIIYIYHNKLDFKELQLPFIFIWMQFIMSYFPFTSSDL